MVKEIPRYLNVRGFSHLLIFLNHYLGIAAGYSSTAQVSVWYEGQLSHNQSLSLHDTLEFSEICFLHAFITLSLRQNVFSKISI